MAALLHCDPREVVFTGGGTEADNMAVLGAVRRRRECHVITSAIEHTAVLSACAQLEREGAAVTRVPVDCRWRGRSGRRPPRAAAGHRADLDHARQ